MSAEFFNGLEISSLPVFLSKKRGKISFFELLGAEAFAMFTQCRNVCAKGTETFRLLPLKGQAVLGPNRLLSMEIKFLIYTSALWAAHSSSRLTCSNK